MEYNLDFLQVDASTSRGRQPNNGQQTRHVQEKSFKILFYCEMYKRAKKALDEQNKNLSMYNVRYYNTVMYFAFTNGLS